jgi:hypothetical protein
MQRALELTCSDVGVTSPNPAAFVDSLLGYIAQ